MTMVQLPSKKKKKNKIDNQKDPYEHIESNVMGKTELHAIDPVITLVHRHHFSFPYYFTISISEFRIQKFALRI